jgi:hypothetical protein
MNLGEKISIVIINVIIDVARLIIDEQTQMPERSILHVVQLPPRETVVQP